MLGAAVCLTALGTVAAPAFAAGESEVKVIVSGNAITNSDIKHRMAFLKLQRKSGNLNQLARNEAYRRNAQAHRDEIAWHQYFR